MADRSDMNKLLTINALTHHETNPTEAIQYATHDADGAFHFPGDQHQQRRNGERWNASGTSGAEHLERDITIAYGPWRPIGTAPAAEVTDPDMVDVDPIDVQDGDIVTVTGVAHLVGNRIDINDSSGMCIGNAFRAMGEPITVRRKVIPLPKGEGALIRCLIHGLDGERIAERQTRIGHLKWWVPGYPSAFADDQIARVLAVYEDGKEPDRG